MDSHHHMNFPMKLFYLLECGSHHDILSWQPHGHCFQIYDEKRFMEEIGRYYFKFQHFAALSRQLALYGFKKIAKGSDMNCFYHCMFQRDNPELLPLMQSSHSTRFSQVSTQALASHPFAAGNINHSNSGSVDSYQDSNMDDQDDNSFTFRLGESPSPPAVTATCNSQFSIPPISEESSSAKENDSSNGFFSHALSSPFRPFRKHHQQQQATVI